MPTVQLTQEKLARMLELTTELRKVLDGTGLEQNELVGFLIGEAWTRAEKLGATVEQFTELARVVAVNAAGVSREIAGKVGRS